MARGRLHRVSGVLRFGATVLVWLCLLLHPARAAFTSLYVFGDGACSTTDGPGGSYYYGDRYSNGRIWVEVLAQWQGVSYESTNNYSWYGHYSSNMISTVSSLQPPADASNALFVVWACDADFVKFLEQ